MSTVNMYETVTRTEVDELGDALRNLSYNYSLNDVDTTGLAAGKLMKYDGTKWVVSDDAGGIGDVTAAGNHFR
jgi:hypothetical protein